MVIGAFVDKMTSWYMKIAIILVKFAIAFCKPFGWFARKLEDHYDGRFAGLPQTIFALGIALIAFSPFYVYVILLALMIQPPYCYIIFGLWITFIVSIITGAAYITYSREKASIAALSSDFSWNIEKYLNDYLEELEKQRIRRHKKR